MPTLAEVIDALWAWLTALVLPPGAVAGAWNVTPPLTRVSW